MRVGLVVCSLSAGFLFACGASSPSSLEFVDISPAEPRLGEITTIRFKAIDGRGQPMAGAPVAFRLQTDKPGVTLSPTQVSTNKGDGFASTQIIATTRVSSVVVEAASGDKVVVSPPLTFAGSVPNAKQFTFQCGPLAGEASGGIHAIGAYDETRYLIAGVKLECFAHVGDRNGDGVPKALVSFMTEAGTLGPSDTSVADVVGNAQTLFKTSYPLPVEVAPGAFSWSPAKDATHTGDYIAPLWMHPFLWIPNPVTQYGLTPTLQEPRRQDPLNPARAAMNPRDNLVTMIAITTGEESFDDVNNNGKYDQNEPYDDLTEPFVDSNDNGTWDPDERYVDTNGNARWDGKNGVYDASTLIWVAERILWTGIPHLRDFSGAEPVGRLIQPTTPPAISHLGSENGVVLIADPWFNAIAQNGDSDGCKSAGDTDKELVKMIGGQDKSGVRMTYPSPGILVFSFRDGHDPFASPPDPAWNPALAFTMSIACELSASPKEGHKIKLVVATITGTVL